jgi:hypothetical protein
MRETPYPALDQREIIGKVPVGRYFFFVGSLLLPLLSFGNRYLADDTSQNFRQEAGDADKAIIRINSAHKWPDRIVFDTSLPTIIVTPPEQQTANAPGARPSTEAFAQVIAPLPKLTEKPVRSTIKRKVVARRASVGRTAAFWPGMSFIFYPRYFK